MKIWITRRSAFSIQCGGLERLNVWFRKPSWVNEWRDRASYDLPFGQESELNGARISEWEVRCDNSSGIARSMSFGKLFGYNDRESEGENSLAEFVWHKVCEHFDQANFDKWHELENSGNDKYQISKFLLEIDLDIKFT